MKTINFAFRIVTSLTADRHYA